MPCRAEVVMDVSIIICTVNRAAELRDTLKSLSLVRAPRSTELIVVDNHSTDDTKQVVQSAAADFPFPIRYLFVRQEGKYAALNAGIRASTGHTIAATDDDARF